MDHSSSTWHAPLHVKDTKSEKRTWSVMPLKSLTVLLLLALHLCNLPGMAKCRGTTVITRWSRGEIWALRKYLWYKWSFFFGSVWAFFLDHIASTYEGYISLSYVYSICCTIAHELAQPCPEPLNPPGWRGPGRCLVQRCAQSQVSTQSRSGCNLYSADQIDC